MNRKKSIIITKVKIAKGKIKINYDKSREGFSESLLPAETNTSRRYVLIYG